MTHYNWAILGLGAMAEQFTESFSHPNATLKAAASRSLEKAQHFANQHDIEKAYGSYDELFNDDSIDIIYIATPHNHHIDSILSALNHGKHVLCEKAITLNGLELEKAVSLAKKKNLVLAEAMTIFHMPLFENLKKRMANNEFGQLKMIQASFGSYKEADATNRFFNPDLAGGALLDIGTYAVSFVRYFLSEQPNDVHSLMSPFETGVDEQSVTIFKNKQNEMATVALTFQAKMPKQCIIALEKAYITVTDYPRADTATLTYLDGSSDSITVGNTQDALVYEVADMIDYIEGKKSNTSLELTQDVMTLLDTMSTQWASRN
ncbi:Gfo/Idh/MocA family oxidoreductase [Vagococcus sp. PNs007]|uniref:Gfo/Idh/MocA family oxidoreductase n=1 Tax=Vagococcus proximus TaxID=2991417 RepID=A0ABT5X0E4_9ENTE|nr:Gfo/Idh/MocA family oxidoreductase [Vagococcus proximus]MDF0479454.1 Gfo/Idh/MocA family oxidoreductase [Vagococcus proximus]